MTAFLIDMLSWASLLAGGFFLIVGSLGMVRLPDFWARLHAASVIDSAGVGLLLFGMMLQGGLSVVTIKLVLIVVFLFLTGPTATHAVANAAMVSGSKPKDMVKDETAVAKAKKAPKPKAKTTAKRKQAKGKV